MKALRSTFRRLMRNKFFAVGLVFFLVVFVVAIFADHLAPMSYRDMDVPNALQPPSREMPFGTDQFGRCVLSRVIYGSRIALWVGAVIVIIQTTIGIFMGLVAGFQGGYLDSIISYLTDVTWSMPVIVFALAIVMVLGPSLNNVIIAIAVVSWAQLARVVRSKTQSAKNKPYTEAARALGMSNTRLVLRHIFPNILSPIIVLTTLALPQAILATTALSFLGLGSQPPAPDWGVILNEGIDFIEFAPWISIFPGLAIVWTVLGFNLLGVGLRDILDPTLMD